ncbi:MAG: NADH-quinone oxidoreductase subunit N [Gammaproteobacteria bacterium]|nr:NADH-quinone oxidoreductase subunit N [Gammaproteobacteria bacterium]
MTPSDFAALTPYLVITGGLLVLMLTVSAVRNHLFALIVTLIVFVATLFTLGSGIGSGAVTIDEFLRIDGYSTFFSGLFLVAGIVTAVLAYRYFQGRARYLEEFYILLVTSTLGAMTMAAAHNFAAFILGLEVMSISLYAMIAYPEEGQAPLEAAVKYLVLSGVGTTTMLFGMALAYNATGTLVFVEAMSLDGNNDTYLVVGQAMVLIGVAFKLSLVPFHMWTPDVYHGAPAPVTGYIATVSKGAVVALLLRYIIEVDALDSDALFSLVALIAMLSMVVGNLLALLQDNLKRILAYSSIAHMGYLLIALLLAARAADPQMAVEVTMVYLVGYFLMTLAAFGVMTVLSASAASDADDLSLYRGLFWRRPLLAGVLATAALSLAGIPLTLGFIAKFYLFAAGIEGALWSLIWALIIGSAIGIYYYVRIIFTMTMPAVADTDEHPGVSWEGLGTVVVLGASLIVLGIYPTPLIDLVQDAVRLFGN